MLQQYNSWFELKPSMKIQIQSETFWSNKMLPEGL